MRELTLYFSKQNAEKYMASRKDYQNLESPLNSDAKFIKSLFSIGVRR